MKRILLLAAFTSALSVLSAAPAQAVVDGVPDGEAHPYVVAIRTPASRGLCSGVKISERRVLTAAHCLVPLTQVRVVFGQNAAAPTGSTLGTIHRHPGWCAGCAGGVPGIDTNDVAVVVTDEPMAAPFAMLPPLGFADTLGSRQALTSIGYGFRVRPKDFAGEVLRRYRVTQELVEAQHRLSDEYLRLSAAHGGTCTGDSGGPSLLGDVVVGLTAFTVNGNCAGVTYAQRVDVAQTRHFIDSVGT